MYDVPGYLHALSEGAIPPEEREALDPDTRAREALLLGLRSVEGVRPAEVLATTGVDLRSTRAEPWAKELHAGNVTDENGRWLIPRAHWLQADGITARLF